MPAENKQPIIVISNSASGGASKDKESKDTFKLGNFKVPMGTVLKIGGLLAVAGIGYYAYTQLPVWMDQISQWGQQPASGAAVSGAGVATSSPSIVTQMPVYPGTGAGTFPPIAGATGAYPYTTQGYPTQYPYTMAPSTAVASQTPMPVSPLGTSVRSYHAHMADGHYLDHKGKRRKFIDELHIEEVVGSDEETERVLSLNEG